jgi:hypothetical protein
MEAAKAWLAAARWGGDAGDHAERSFRCLADQKVSGLADPGGGPGRGDLVPGGLFRDPRCYAKFSFPDGVSLQKDGLFAKGLSYHI